MEAPLEEMALFALLVASLLSDEEVVSSVHQSTTSSSGNPDLDANVGDDFLLLLLGDLFRAGVGGPSVLLFFLLIHAIFSSTWCYASSFVF